MYLQFFIPAGIQNPGAGELKNSLSLAKHSLKNGADIFSVPDI
jgi:hypothetical protein